MSSVALALAPRRRRRTLVLGAWMMALLVLLAALAVGVVSYLAADRLVHPPRDLAAATPAHRGLPFEPATFTTEDGLRLSAWWVPARDEAQGTVVFLHGYGASKAQSLSVAPFLHRGGWNVLAFDLRAHGFSEGARVTFGIDEAADVRAAVAWALAREPGLPVALFGWSMGGATALLAAPAIPEVRAVVADSAFARLDNVVSHGVSSLTGLPDFPFAPATVAMASLITRRHVDDSQPARAAERLERPLLLIQGTHDALVRADVDALELGLAAGARGELWLAAGADHVNARRDHPQEYEGRVLAFLARHVAAAG